LKFLAGKIEGMAMKEGFSGFFATILADPYMAICLILMFSSMVGLILVALYAILAWDGVVITG